MADHPAFAELPEPPPDALGWYRPAPDGQVRLGLTLRQHAAWVVVVGGVVLLLIGVALQTGRPLIIAPAATLVVGSLAYGRWLGADLGPATLTIRGWSPRAHTIAWSSVLAVDVTERGQLQIKVPHRKPIALVAPRERWVVRDPAFPDKAKYLRGWWLARRQAPNDPAELRPSATAATARQHSRRWTRGVDQPAGLGRLVPFSLVPSVLLVVASVIVGYLIVGNDVVVLSVAIFVLVRFGREPGRPLALAAFVLLVLAAVATVAQESPGAVNLGYASRRTIAAGAGAVVGVLLVLLVIIWSVTERSPDAAAPRPLWQRGTRAIVAALAHTGPNYVRFFLPYVPVALVALAGRIALLPEALPPGHDALIDNLRLGTGYSLTAPSGGVPTGAIPPLSSVLVAFFPLGAKVTLLVVSLAVVAVIARAAYVRWGRAASVSAAAIAAVLPSLWTQQLPMQLAGLFVLAGVALADPARVTPRRAAWAGLCLGLAFLARPDAGIAAIVVVAWLVDRLGARANPSIVALAAGAALPMVPWLRFVSSEFGGLWPMSSLGVTLNDPWTVTRFGVFTIGIGYLVVAASVSLLRRQREHIGELLPFFVLPAATTVLALTDPVHRDPLTWSAPLVVVLLGWRVAANRWSGWRYPGIDDEVTMPDWDGAVERARRRAGLSLIPPEPVPE